MSFDDFLNMKVTFGKPKEKEIPVVSQKPFPDLNECSVCLTGKFQNYPKAIIEQSLRGFFPRVMFTDSITRRTNFLICADRSKDQSTKYMKAKEYGTSVISETEIDEFLTIV